VCLVSRRERRKTYLLGARGKGSKEEGKRNDGHWPTLVLSRSVERGEGSAKNGGESAYLIGGIGARGNGSEEKGRKMVSTDGQWRCHDLWLSEGREVRRKGGEDLDLN